MDYLGRLAIRHRLTPRPIEGGGHVDNVASRKVIEACGGEFDDQRGAKLRFWVATPAVPAA